MKNKLFYAVFSVLLILISSCGNMNNHKVAKGNVVYGGSFRINETENYQTLFPGAITDVGSADIANQIYEGLVKFNSKDLSIIPSLAKKWDMDEKGTTYTFYLKKGVMFHDNECFPNRKGRELKASDVKFSFELLCTDLKDNSNFSGTFKDCVIGANKFFEKSKGKPNGDIEGLKILNDSTVSISLISPSSSFIFMLASPAASIIAKEAFDKYGVKMKIGTGPFMFNEKSGKDKVVLLRNNNYHKTDSLGNQLPYLDSVIFSFLSTKKEELDNFTNGDYP